MKKLIREHLDVVYVVIKSHDTEALVDSVCASLSDENNFLDLMGCFNAAENQCNTNHLTGQINLRDLNTRHTARGDTTSDGFGNFFRFLSLQPTLVNSHVNKGSGNNSCLCDSPVCNLLSDAVADKEVEVFKGAPSIGLWPFCFNLNITKSLSYSEIRLELTRV